MLKPSFTISLASLSLLALLLGACGAVTIKPSAQATAEFEAAVAQTIAAKSTATPIPTLIPTRTPTITPTATITETLTPSPIPPTSVVDTYCDNSAFVADVTIPDKTVLAPGQVFEKTWMLQNTGTCPWTQGYTIAWMNGDPMKGTTRPLDQTVAPNGQANVTVKLTAPFTPGEYSGVWRLVNSKGEPFGEFVSVVITVAGSGTPVSTPTP